MRKQSRAAEPRAKCAAASARLQAGNKWQGFFFLGSLPQSLARSLPPSLPLLISHPLSRLARRWPTPYSMFSVSTSNQRSHLRCSPNQPQMCRRRYLTTGTDGAFPWKTHSSATRPAPQHTRKITNVIMLIFSRLSIAAKITHRIKIQIYLFFFCNYFTT